MPDHGEAIAAVAYVQRLQITGQSVPDAALRRIAGIADRLILEGDTIRIDPEFLRPDQNADWRGTVTGVTDDGRLLVDGDQTARLSDQYVKVVQ